MVTANKRGTLPVEGACKRCGTKVTGTAPPGRVTLRCTCPKEGCGAQVIARRPVPGKHGSPTTVPDQPAGPDPADAPITKGKAKRKRVPRVDYDQDNAGGAAGARPEQGPDRPTEDQDPGVRPGPSRARREHGERDGTDPHDTGGDDAAGGGDEPGPGPDVGEDHGSGRKQRLQRLRRRARAGHSEAGHRRAPYEFLNF